VKDTPAALFMNDIHNIRKPVRRIETFQAEETLGVWISPDGNTKTQFQKMIEKATLWVDQMRSGIIRKEEAWLALTSTIWRTLCYPLNATNLSLAQCEAIMSPVLRYALPAMGVCRTFPRALVFSSTQYMGLGIRHIHTLQEITRLKDIINHTYTNTTTGHLYRASIEHLILELDMDTDLSVVNYKKFQGLATNSLIKSTWEFLYTHKIRLKHDIEIPKNTSRDIPLMILLCTQDLTSQELEAINQCRLYLKAYYISNITTASGKGLSLHAWEGVPRDNGATNRLSWPNQGIPSKSSWDIWRKCLKRNIISRGLRIKQEIREWIHPDHDLWPWL
jgi:hypothetical protein